MEHRKQLIMDALSKFAESRGGLEFGNYGDWKAYRAEQRQITKDLHHARTLLRAVSWRDSITAEDLLAAAKRAYSGRLTITFYEAGKPQRNDNGVTSSYPVDTVKIWYCPGQYYPTEYRRAVCAVLAYALWDYTREHAMPSKIVENGEEFYPHADGSRNRQSGGEWLRTHFRREFGRNMAQRWFS